MPAETNASQIEFMMPTASAKPELGGKARKVGFYLLGKLTCDDKPRSEGSVLPVGSSVQFDARFVHVTR